MRKFIYILILFAGILFSSCNNDDDSICETWRVQEWIIDNSTGNYLQQPTTSDKTLCSDDIKPAGITYVWHEEGNVKYYRKMIQKL